MKKLLVLLLFCATAPLWAQPNTQYRMDDIMYHCDTFISINSHNRNYQDLHDGMGLSIDPSDQALIDSIFTFVKKKHIKILGLDIDQNFEGITPVVPLDLLPDLEYLWIDCVLKNNEEAQQDILKMKKLKVLRWFNKGNTLLANIDQLSELIILYPGELDSLSCKISKLKHLKFFTFDGSPNVNTISCKLPESLTYLDINGTSISNIDNIFDLAPNLKGMDMRSTKIKSVSNTCPIEKLQSLTLCNCGIDYSVYRRAKDAGAYCFVSPWCAETEQNWQPDPGD